MLKFRIILFIIGGLLFISNTNGFMFSHKDKCGIKAVKGGKDFGGEKIMANTSFVPYLKSIGAVAKGCKVKVQVIDSYKQLKNPTDFVLAAELPLALGRGIRFNLQDPKGGTVCNKLCMVARSWKTIPEAKCFIDGIQKKGVKFTEPNLLDDGYAAKLSATDANALKTAAQKLCAPKVKAPRG